jgi:flagellar motility protein MotE (MotC chaperone)
MTLKIPAPRVLPMTIATLAALLAVKCGDLLEAVLITGHTTPAGMVAAANAAAATDAPAEKTKPPAPAPEQKPPEAAPVAEGPPAISDSERAVLLELRQRRKELDVLADSLAAREAVLAAAEQKLAARVAELQSLQQRLEVLDVARQQKEDADWQGLVKMYEAMKPKEAAAIFDDLSMPVLLQVLNRMKDAKAAAVMASMAPERARDVTAELVRMRTRHEPPPAAAAVKSSGS